MKKFLLLAALACGSLSAMAQTVNMDVTGVIDNDAKTGTLSFNVHNPGETYCAMQFDVVFPEGMTPKTSVITGGISTTDGAALEKEAKFSTNSAKQADGSYRFVLYNGYNFHFYEGTMFTIDVTTTSDFSKADLIIKNILIANSGASSGVGTGAISQETTTAISVPVKLQTLVQSTSTYVSTIAIPYTITLPSTIKVAEGENKGTYVYIDDKTESSTVEVDKAAFLFSSAKADLTCYGVSKGATSAQGAVLTGNYAESVVAAGSLVLSGGTLKELTKTEEKFPAFKAYIPAGSKVKGMMIGDFETSLDAIAADDEEVTIYNVAGMRMNKTQKGLNIINGKKVMVK